MVKADFLSLSAEEKKTIESYDRIADKWNDVNPAHWRDEFWYIFTERLKGKLILDVGCSTGRDAKMLTEDGFRCVGVDLSFAMLAKGKEILGAEIAKGRAFLMRSNILAIPLRSKMFDGFVCFTTLMHLPRFKTLPALKEIRRVLKHGAIGYISIPYGTMSGMYNGRSEKFGNDRPVLVNSWLPPDFDDLLRQVSFGFIAYERVGDILHYIVRRN